MSDPYLYSDTNVLINKLGIEDAETLEEAEIEYVTHRISMGIPDGDFDLEHLQAIHRHLFQDVYEWAGEIRTLEINKGGSQFQFRQYIRIGMADVHSRIVDANYLKNLRPAQFATQAGAIIGDVNYAHPFREGNGRAQVQYLKQLGQRAGHPLDLSRLNQEQWIHASKEAHMARYESMAKAIHSCIITRENEKDLGHER